MDRVISLEVTTLVELHIQIPLLGVGHTDQDRIRLRAVVQGVQIRIPVSEAGSAMVPV